MASRLAPLLLRRGLELFAVISIAVFVAVLFYGNNLEQFADAMLHLRWQWVIIGLLVASLDWFGGGLRLYVLLRHVYPKQSLKGAIISAGINAFGMMLTPSQAGGAPFGIFALKRYGTPVPEAMVATFVSFVATVLFFTVAGPTVILLGAGDSLAEHGILGVTNLHDLFRLSMAGFIGIGLVILALMIFPNVARRLARRIVGWLERRGSVKLADRVSQLNEGIDRAHEAMVAFFRGRGWLALAASVVLTAPTLANKLFAGYIVLQALGIHAPLADVLMLQTLIIFLLYFAPTPGGSGLAEVLSGAVMSIYVPRELTPSYILLWRIYVAYLTVGVGSFVFWRWLKDWEGRPEEAETEPPANSVAPPQGGH
jgi:uncharacterized protein (TIRG00374 family)